MKAVKFLLVLVFAFIPFNTALASGEKTMDSYLPMDIDEHWAYEEIDDLINADIIEGFMDSDNNMYVKPKDSITRAEFVKMIVSALGLKSDGTGKSFSDVKQNVWYSDSIKIASDLGIIDGKPGGKFAPNDKITRAELTKVIVIAFEKSIKFPNEGGASFADVDVMNWASEYIRKASATDIVTGYESKFNPKSSATRAEAMVMIHRALQKENSKLAEDTDITAFLKDHITRENALSETNSYEELVNLYKENGIGYYRAEGIELGGMPLPIEEGEEYSLTVDDKNLSLSIVEKSDRFATVEVTGVVISVIYKSADFNMDFTSKLDGIYKLKKDPSSGNWKIYSYYPSFEEEL